MSEPGKGAQWDVVGGIHCGGIIVRKARDIRSPQIGRLGHGAVVVEVACEGDRLHYQKVRGEGPPSGWVSLHVNGTALLSRRKLDTTGHMLLHHRSLEAAVAPLTVAPPAPGGEVHRASCVEKRWTPELEALARERHTTAATDFREMLLRMRSETSGGVMFANGLRVLLSCGAAAGTQAFHCISSPKYRDLKGLASELCKDMARVWEDPGNSGCGLALTALTRSAEQFLSVYCSDACALHTGCDWLEGVPKLPPVGRHIALRLVYLPLAVYVRNSPYLYEMLARVQASWPYLGEAPAAAGPKAVRATGALSYGANGREQLANLDGPTRIRAILDVGGLQYSFMVYAVVAALQVLLMLRQADGPSFPLELLGSGVPQRNDTRSFRMEPLGAWAKRRREFGRTLLFRGLWVDDLVDEERTRFQRSVNSFSRSIGGVVQVLDCYAGAEGSQASEIAHRARHVLLYVLRMDWADPEVLAMPVQVFGGSDEASEKEVLLPPFARYQLEDDLAMCSDDFTTGGGVEGRRRLDAVKRRWNKNLEKLAPRVVHALRGNFDAEGMGKSLPTIRPRFSVRFIGSWSLPEPIKELFSERQQLLYSFPGK